MELKERTSNMLHQVNGFKLGDPVQLITPENPVLNNTRAEILEFTEWGAHVQAPAAHTGRFRAHWTEMVHYDPPVQRPTRNGIYKESVKSEVTGDACPTCGGVNLVRTGSCKTCQDCGTNEGCG